MVVNCLKNKKGFTLVEMIISLALISILVTAAMRIISVDLAVYHKNKVSEDSGIVADYLLTSIENELANVTGGGNGNRLTITLGHAYKDSADKGEGVQYYDKDGRKSCIYVENGELVFHKYAITSSDGLRSEDGTLITDKSAEAYDVFLPKENYKGFTVTSIVLNTSSYYRMFGSSFTVTLNLYNEKYDYSYSKGMSIESFNGAYIKGPYNLIETDKFETFVID